MSLKNASLDRSHDGGAVETFIYKEFTEECIRTGGVVLDLCQFSGHNCKSRKSSSGIEQILNGTIFGFMLHTKRSSTSVEL